MKCSTAIKKTTSSPRRIDHLLEIDFFNGIGSWWGGYNTAPVSHGPGLVRHEPSVKANVVFSGDSIIMSSISSLPSSACSRVLDFEDPSRLQYCGMCLVIMRPPASYSAFDSILLISILVATVISSTWAMACDMGEICLLVMFDCAHQLKACLMGWSIPFDWIFIISLIAISAKRRSKGSIPTATSLASRLAVDGSPKQIANLFLCTS